MLGAALISAFSGALTKILSAYMPAMEIVFLRNLFGLFLIMYALKHTPPKLLGGKWYLLLTRGVFGFLAMILFFYTIETIPLGEAITLNKTSPFFVTLLAYYLLKEHLNLATFVALLIGFVGVVLIVKPMGMSMSYEHFLGVLGGFFAAAAYTTIKKIKDIYDSRIIMLSFVVVGTLLPGVLFLLSPFVTPPKELAFLFPALKFPQEFWIWILVLFMAFVATLSQWLLTKAYSFSNLSIIGVISYTNIPFAIGFGWMLGDTLPGSSTFLGIAFIVFGGFLVTLYKQKNNKI